MSLKMSSILERLRAHIIFFKNLFPQDITCALYLQGRESIVSIFVKKKKDKQTFFFYFCNIGILGLSTNVPEKEKNRNQNSIKKNIIHLLQQNFLLNKNSFCVGINIRSPGGENKIPPN